MNSLRSTPTIVAAQEFRKEKYRKARAEDTTSSSTRSRSIMHRACRKTTASTNSTARDRSREQLRIIVRAVWRLNARLGFGVTPVRVQVWVRIRVRPKGMSPEEKERAEVRRALLLAIPLASIGMCAGV